MGPTPEATTPDWRRYVTPGRIFFLACLLHALWAVSLGWDNTICDEHPFRQTQTALSAYYMVGQPPKLAYETPVKGPPWSIPMEFPVYQWIVAGLTTVFGTPLEQTGRFVSVAFFFLTLVPANLLLRRLEVGAEGRLIILGLFLLSPFFLFWSRTFMIESTALFLSVAFLAAFAAALETPLPLAAALLFGGLAGPVKVTTFASYLLAAGLLTARAWWVGRRAPFRVSWPTGRLALVALLLSFPILTTALWTHFADAQKELNPLGKGITSSNLRNWNFGTLQQRLDPSAWVKQVHRPPPGAHVPVNVPVLVGLAGLLLTRQRWQLALACLALYFSAFLIFFNVYRHSYYPYANNIFLVTAAGLGLVGLLEANRVLRALAPGLLLALFGLECYRHIDWYGPSLRTNSVAARDIGRVIEAATRDDEVLVGLGFDWTSELAFYSRRRTLMQAGTTAEGLSAFPDCLKQLEGYRLGAVVLNKKTLDANSRDDPHDRLAQCGWEGRVVYDDGTVVIYAAAPQRSASRD